MDDTKQETPESVPDNTEPQPGNTEAPGGEDTQKPEKTYTKAEMTEAIRREALKAEAKAERRAIKAYQETLERVLPKKQVQQHETKASGRPSQEQYANVDDYVEAMAEWKLGQRDREYKEQRARAEQEKAIAVKEKVFAEASKDPSFDEEHFLSLPLSPLVASAILESDVSSKILVFLNANPDETRRINGLSPARQAVEIGKLEVKLGALPATSKAPSPISPIGGSGKGNKAVSEMTDDEYAKWRAKGRK